MTLIKYQPSTLQKVQSELDHFLNLMPWAHKKPASIYEWQPSADLEETDATFLVKVDVPGVDPKDIQVDLTNNVLTIAGERNIERKKKGKYERFDGKFIRQFALPSAVDEKGIKATGKHGILEIAIPKTEKSKARMIEVESL